MALLGLCQQPEDVTISADQRPATSPARHHQLSTGAKTHKFRVSAFFTPTCCLQRNSWWLHWAVVLHLSTFGAVKSRSLTQTLVDTLAPASLQIRATALSKAKPRRPNTPVSAACCAVVAKRIEKMATPASARDRRQKQTKASEKQHTKEICINACGIVRRCSSQRCSRSWTALGTSRELAPERPEKAILSIDGGGVPHEKSSTSPHCARLHFHCFMVWKACTSAESTPSKARCFNPMTGCRSQTGPPGLAHDSPRTPNVHISGHLRFKRPPKFHEKTPERHRNSETVAEKGRKSAKFWAPHPSGPHPFGTPPFRGPTLRVEPRWVKH